MLITSIYIYLLRYKEKPGKTYSNKNAQIPSFNLNLSIYRIKPWIPPGLFLFTQSTNKTWLTLKR